MSLSHEYTSPDADDGSGKIQPSHWNGAHKLGGKAIGAGTSFPGSPATDDMFYRFDLHMWFYYDSARWLSDQLFEVFDGRAAQESATFDRGLLPDFGAQTIYLVDCRWMYNTGATHSASHYWTAQLTGWITGTVLATLVTDKSTTNDAVNPTPTAIGTVVAATHRGLYWHTIKTGTPSNTYFAFSYRYRVIAT